MEAPKIQNIAFPVCKSSLYGQTVRDIHKSRKIDPPPQVEDGQSDETIMILQTGSGTQKTRNIAHRVCTSGLHGQTGRDINKSHKIDPTQVENGQ